MAYVDTDPVVLAHARALLATSDGVTAAGADLRDPAAVLADPGLRAVIDPAEPVAVILGAMLHFLDADAARQVTAGYAQVMVPGSCLVISVARYDDETLAKQLAAEYTAGQFINHTPADIASFFAGLDMTGPGLAEAQTWRAWMPAPVLRRRTGHVLAGIALRRAATGTARFAHAVPGIRQSPWTADNDIIAAWPDARCRPPAGAFV